MPHVDLLQEVHLGVSSLDKVSPAAHVVPCYVLLLPMGHSSYNFEGLHLVAEVFSPCKESRPPQVKELGLGSVRHVSIDQSVPFAAFVDTVDSGERDDVDIHPADFRSDRTLFDGSQDSRRSFTLSRAKPEIYLLPDDV